MATAQVKHGHDGNPFTLEQFVAAAQNTAYLSCSTVADRLPWCRIPYLSRGADLVAYSGGKIIRGPQTAGMLLGRKDLIAAAFINSAPHHAFARAMKVSKEEIVGMVKAIELLRSGKRNRDAEDKEWRSWFRYITRPGVEGARRFRPDHRAERQAVLPHDEGRVGPDEDRDHGRRGR